MNVTINSAQNVDEIDIRQIIQFERKFFRWLNDTDIDTLCNTQQI